MKIWSREMTRKQLLLAAIVAAGTGLWLGFIAGSTATGLACGAGLGILYYYFAMHKYNRRRRLVSTPFPESWRDLLQSCVPFYRKLAGPARRRFENDVRIFIAEQTIYGIRGAPVPDDIKVMIAASAATLGHGLPDWEWPSVRDIVVYPAPFDEEYAFDGSPHLAGMVHSQGPILFSESDLRHGFCSKQKDTNVSLHEFAHVMDMADGEADGVPAGWVATAPWVRILADRLQRVRQKDCRNILRSYAGVNEAEFFAVAVEAFFEQPERLKRRDRELFDLLTGYFNIDPVTGKMLSGMETVETD